MTFQLKKLVKSEVEALAKRLADVSKKGDLFFLSGDLGAGKTTFTKSFIATFFTEDITVTSPTFTLFNVYQSTSQTICHSDLYRLKDPNELLELGLLDGLSEHITLVEWPDLLKEVCALNAIELLIEQNDHETRTITLSFYGAMDESTINRFKNAFLHT